MSDPLHGPLHGIQPVRRLNKRPLMLISAVLALTLFLIVFALARMGSRSATFGGAGAKPALPTQGFVDKWLADKPTGVIGQAIAAEPVPSSLPEFEPVNVVVVEESQQSPMAQEHGEAVQKALYAERQRILEEKMQRQQMAIRAPSAVPFNPSTREETPALESQHRPTATDPMAGVLASMQERLSHQSGGGSTAGRGSNVLAGLGLSQGDGSEAAWQHFDHKQGFLQSDGGASNYLAKSRTAALGNRELKSGTTIPAVMITGANSDLPGQMLAQVSANVWDSIDGSHVLIPQGARLVGRYDSAVQYGQHRLLVVWDRVIYPDGSSLDLDAMQGQDKAGNSGFKDKVNNHFGRIFGSALLMSAITAGIETSVDVEVGTDGEIFRSEVADQLGEVATEMLRKNLRIAPTITIRPGYRFGVMVNKDIILPPYVPMQSAIRRMSP